MCLCVIAIDVTLVVINFVASVGATKHALLLMFIGLSFIDCLTQMMQQKVTKTSPGVVPGIM